MAELLTKTYDLAVIGGGIIGLATARQVLLKHPGLKVIVFEKEKRIASHQSARNSGVVHRGIYYKKGSLRSRFCIRGANLIEEYCKKNQLPYKECGKLIVATDKLESDRLNKLYENALAADVKNIELIETKQITDIQPGCHRALRAIWSPKTAITNWQMVAESFAKDFINMGGHIETEFPIVKIEQQGSTYELMSGKSRGSRTGKARSVVNCAGLYSEAVARLSGNNPHPKVVPFKGNYHILSERLAPSIKTNIYPVPDPELPFLGVHITPRIDGSVIVGPNALIALGYEHYHNVSLPRIGDLIHIFFLSGLRKLVFQKKNFKAGLRELWNQISVFSYTKHVSRLLPSVTHEDLGYTQFCGIRAQAVTKDGRLVDDFLIESGVRPGHSKILHVRNCPSPAATASLALAERIVTTLEQRELI